MLVVGPQLGAVPHGGGQDDIVGEGQPAGGAETSRFEGEREAERRHARTAHHGHRLCGGGVAGDLQQMLRDLENADGGYDKLVKSGEGRPIGLTQGRGGEDFEPAA